MLTKINKDILKIYLKHNPSLPRSIKSKISVIEDLVNFKLNLPINDLKKKKLLILLVELVSSHVILLHKDIMLMVMILILIQLILQKVYLKN